MLLSVRRPTYTAPKRSSGPSRHSKRKEPPARAASANATVCSWWFGVAALPRQGPCGCGPRKYVDMQPTYMCHVWYGTVALTDLCDSLLAYFSTILIVDVLSETGKTVL